MGEGAWKASATPNAEAMPRAAIEIRMVLLQSREKILPCVSQKRFMFGNRQQLEQGGPEAQAAQLVKKLTRKSFA